MTLFEELKNLLKSEVLNDEKTLNFYSFDASAFQIKPEVIVFPKDVEDLKRLVKFLQSKAKLNPENHPSLTVRGAGTDMTGGPLNDSIIVDLSKYFNHLIKIGPDFVVGQPGLLYRDLEPKILEKDLFFPSYPASKMWASLGGIVANNAGGEKSLKYGQTKDYVKELKVILRDGEEYLFKPLSKDELEEKLRKKDFEGEIYRQIFDLISKNYDLIKSAKPQVSKNSTGYFLWDVFDKEKGSFDLTKIFVGSQGTLGIITEITLKLLPREKYSKLLVIYLFSIENLPKLIQEILNFQPTSLESYDDKTLKLAFKYFRELASLVGQEQNLFSFAFDLLPDFWIILKNFRFPKLILLVEFTGNEEKELEGKIMSLQRILKSLKILTHYEKDPKEYWVVRRQSFNLLRQKIKNRQAVPFIDDVIVKPENLPEFLPRLNKILENYPQLVYTIAGHLGDGNFHIIPLMDLTNPKQRNLIPEISQKVYDLVLEFKGSLSAEHNDGLIRGPYLKKMYGEKVYSLFKEAKRIFDPFNIFNPHKKTEADLDWSLKHLKTTNLHYV
jgi:FAD/FMN-containing dehydrogenase